MNKKQKTEFRKLLADLRQSLAPDKLPLAGTIERIAGEVRRDYSRQKAELQEALSRTKAVGELLLKEQSDHKRELAVLAAEMQRLKSASRAAEAERRERETPFTKFLIGCPAFCDDLFIAHLHRPRFLARVADDRDHIHEKLVFNIETLFAHFGEDFEDDVFVQIPFEDVLTDVHWLDPEPAREQAKNLFHLAGQAFILNEQYDIFMSPTDDEQA